MSYLTDLEIGLRQPGGIGASPRQMNGEASSGVARKTAGLGFSVMEFRDEPHYVKSQPEMGAAVVRVAGLAGCTSP